MADHILHKFYVSKSRSRKISSSIDSTPINNQIIIQRDEPESVSQPFAPPKEPVFDDVAGKQRIQDAIKKLQDYLVAAEQMKTLLGDRIKNRTVPINDQEDLPLKQAIARIFGIDADKITFDMFKKCLEIRSQLFGGKPTDIEKR